MTTGRILKLGPSGEYKRERPVTCWIALDDAHLKTQSAGDFLVGKECHSLAQLQADIAQIKSDLDDILREARVRFEGPRLPPENEAAKRFLRNLPDRKERE